MKPVVVGERETKKQIILYSVLLVPIGMSPAFIGMSSWVYGVVAGLLGSIFVVLALAIYRDTGERYARRTFTFSILYLFLIFSMLVVDKAAGFSV